MQTSPPLFLHNLFLIVAPTQPRLFRAVASKSRIVYQPKSIFRPNPRYPGQRGRDLVGFERVVIDEREYVETGT